MAIAVPGAGFGPNGEGYVRIALVENEQRIKQALRQIDAAMNGKKRHQRPTNKRGKGEGAGGCERCGEFVDNWGVRGMSVGGLLASGGRARLCHLRGGRCIVLFAKGCNLGGGGA